MYCIACFGCLARFRQLGHPGHRPPIIPIITHDTHPSRLQQRISLRAVGSECLLASLALTVPHKYRSRMLRESSCETTLCKIKRFFSPAAQSLVPSNYPPYRHRAAPPGLPHLERCYCCRRQDRMPPGPSQSSPRLAKSPCLLRTSASCCSADCVFRSQSRPAHVPAAATWIHSATTGLHVPRQGCLRHARCLLRGLSRTCARKPGRPQCPFG